MQSVNVAEIWREHFGDLPPVSHLMRAALPQRWLRIHSLPDSKRYAQTEHEYAELLRRHNLVAAEIVGTGDAVLFGHCWGSVDEFASAFAEFEWATRSGLRKAEPTPVPTNDDDEHDLLVGGCAIRWSRGAWDDMLRDVADDRLSSVVLVNPRSGEVYAPYDGGADLIVANPERTLALKSRWMGWLSQHPQGL
jgi:hypothetical protein